LFSGSPPAARRQSIPVEANLRVFELGKAEHHEIMSSRRREYMSGVAERRGKYHLTIL
jgi:hypothetical protein